jgi:AcrR family transcriptional regulator
VSSKVHKTSAPERGEGGSSGETDGPNNGPRPKRNRRAELSPEVITRAAIRIADEEGLEAVSIRRVAAALDARAMSLYDHIGSKDELLALMGDAITGETIVPKPLPADWREALTLIARRVYATLVGHPWLVQVSRHQYRRFGPNATLGAEQLAEAVASLNLDATEMWTMVGTMNDYVVGHSGRIIAAPPPASHDEVVPEEALAQAPELAALPDWMRTRSSVERFESGLRIVLNGIEREVAEGSE